MTLDERLEILTRSAESHDEQIGKLTDDIRMLAEKHERLADTVTSLVASQVETGAYIRQVTTVVEQLGKAVLNHEQRLSGLESF